jgi:hypothetical protein
MGMAMILASLLAGGLPAQGTLQATPAGFPEDVLQVRVSSGGERLYLLQVEGEALAGRVHVWSLAEGKVERTLDLPVGISSMAVREGTLTLTSFAGRRLLLLDEPDLQVRQEIELEARGVPLQPAWASEASPPGSVIVSCLGAGLGGRVLEVDLASGSATPLGEFPHLRWRSVGGALLAGGFLSPDGIRATALGVPFQPRVDPLALYWLEDLRDQSRPDRRGVGAVQTQDRPGHRYVVSPTPMLSVHGATALLGGSRDHTALVSADLSRVHWARAGRLLAADARVPLAVLLLLPQVRGPGSTLTLAGVHTAAGEILWRCAVDLPEAPRVNRNEPWGEARLVLGPSGALLVLGLLAERQSSDTRNSLGHWFTIPLPAAGDLQPVPRFPRLALPRWVVEGNTVVVEMRGDDDGAGPPEAPGTYLLLDGPRGVKVGAVSGTLRWKPTSSQLGQWMILAGYERNEIVYPILHGSVMVEPRIE